MNEAKDHLNLIIDTLGEHFDSAIGILGSIKALKEAYEKLIEDYINICEGN